MAEEEEEDFFFFLQQIQTCCFELNFECLICMCFVFLYLHLFIAIEHVSHGKAV